MVKYDRQSGNGYTKNCSENFQQKIAPLGATYLQKPRKVANYTHSTEGAKTSFKFQVLSFKRVKMQDTMNFQNVRIPLQLGTSILAILWTDFRICDAVHRSRWVCYFFIDMSPLTGLGVEKERNIIFNEITSQLSKRYVSDKFKR